MPLQVLYFRADWCGPCKQMAGIVAGLETSYPEVEFKKVDVDQEYKLAAEYHVRAVPTLIHLKDGKEVARLTGARSAREVANHFHLEGIIP